MIKDILVTAKVTTRLVVDIPEDLLDGDYNDNGDIDITNNLSNTTFIDKSGRRKNLFNKVAEIACEGLHRELDNYLYENVNEITVDEDGSRLTSTNDYVNLRIKEDVYDEDDSSFEEI